MNGIAIAIAALLVTGASVTTAGAQQPKPAYKRSVPKALAAQAKISEDSARTIAMSKVANGHVESMQLEREKGKLLYSFDIKAPGRSGVEEVNVDALDGHVIAVEHESDATAAREARAGRAAMKKGAMKKDTTRKP